ncbi:MAG: ImmA/IrrE family metallo-endopeptidase [Longimicrobiales bacterium]
MRADVRPDMIRWARERANASRSDLSKRFPRLADWEQGKTAPTLKQLEKFARAVYVPIGYLFLPEPPDEQLPIPDFRVGRAPGESPSPNLLDTVYICQGRQAWYADYARIAGEPSRAFVGSLTTSDLVERAAAAIRESIGFDLEARRRYPTWTDALRAFIAQAETAGVLVMCSGIVHNNTHRKLDPDEFRGFAMVDPLAPLVFVNGADTKASQMFTLAHELAHVWLGLSALTDSEPTTFEGADIEVWCNRVAAELLVPLAVLREDLRPDAAVPNEIVRLARRFKVSTLVILRRMLDAGALTRTRFNKQYEAELSRIAQRPKTSGGDFYLTQPVRASRRFVTALVESTLEGRTLYRDAFRMLGISKVETFNELGRAVHAIA